MQCQCLIKRNYLIFILWCVWTARKFFIPCVFRTGIIRILRQLNLSRSIYFKKTKSGSTVRQCRRVSNSLQDRRRDWMKRGKSCLSGHWEMVLPSVRAWQKPLKSFVMSLESGVLLRCRRPITKRESSTVMRGMLLKSVGSIIIWMQRLTIRSPKTIQSGMIM